MTNLHTTCSSLMLDAFIQCMEEKHYQRLKKVRLIPISKRNITKAWGMIFEEYCILSKNTGYESFYDSMRRLFKIKIKLIAIENCINVLLKEFNKECVQILWDFGYRYDFNPKNREKYILNINKVYQKSKTLRIEKEKEQTVFDNLQKENEKEQNSGTYFEDILAALSQHQGYRINPKKTSVKEFCSLLARYEKAIQKKNTNERAN